MVNFCVFEKVLIERIYCSYFGRTLVAAIVDAILKNHLSKRRFGKVSAFLLKKAASLLKRRPVLSCKMLLCGVILCFSSIKCLVFREQFWQRLALLGKIKNERGLISEFTDTFSYYEPQKTHFCIGKQEGSNREGFFVSEAASYQRTTQQFEIDFKELKRDIVLKHMNKKT